MRASGARLDYRREGEVEWREIAFVSDISGSESVGTTTEIRGFRQVAKIIGKPGVPSVAVSLASYVAVLPDQKYLDRAAIENNALEFRLVITGDSFGAPAMDSRMAITAADNTVQFSGTKPEFDGDDFAVGLVIDSGDVKYIIESIAEQAAGADPVVTVERLDGASIAADVAAAEYTLEDPSGTLGPFVATISGYGNFTLSEGAALAKSFTLEPRSQLPLWGPS